LSAYLFAAVAGAKRINCNIAPARGRGWRRASSPNTRAFAIKNLTPGTIYNVRSAAWRLTQYSEWSATVR